MKVSHSPKIIFPYNEMLNSLKDVRGFEKFVEFINTRLHNEDWKAEVRALFDINKDGHRLVEICSQGVSQPEGIFEFSGRVGIVESAFVAYLFDQNEQKKKLINNLENWISQFKRYLVGKYETYVFSITVPSVVKFLELSLNSLRNPVEDFFKSSRDRVLDIVKPELHLSIFPKSDQSWSDPPGDSVRVEVEKGSLVERGRNVNLDSKVSQLLHDKRDQHKDKYPNAVKVFYLLVNCPPYKLSEINQGRILGKLKKDEVLVICSEGKISPRWLENKIVLGDVGCQFNFCNKYYDDFNKYWPPRSV